MVEADVHDDRGLGRFDDVGRVEAAAEADLQHDDIAFLLRVPQQRRGGHKLKLRRVIGHRVGRDLHERHIRCEHIVVDLLAVYLHALVEAPEIGRGEKAGAVARLAQHRGRHGRAAALAVGAGDVDEFQPLLRVAQFLQQLA